MVQGDIFYGSGTLPYIRTKRDASTSFGEGDTKTINDAAGRLVQQYLKIGEFVDFVRKESLGGYFDTVEPFYKK